MPPKRVLIVEPDHAFALSLASLFREDGHATAVARNAAEAELEIASRRPDLAVIRAELPDLSGFSLCAHLRHDRATAELPVVLFSSDTPPESLAEHARTPWAANGYLAMPLDTDALRVLANRVLAAEVPVENADDAIMEADDLVVQELHGEEVPSPAAAEAPPPAEAPAGPAVPALPKRSVTTDEDRLFLDRVFQSIGEHRDVLAREAMGRRPPPRRDLLATPEGRIEALRQDLKWREAQIARIAEIWAIRDRELASFDQRIHERDVDIAGLKSQVEDLSRRVVEARDTFVTKEREYGASIDGLLLEKFSQEKQLIEVVAANERRIHELERDVRRRDDDLAHRKVTLAEAQEEIARLDRQARAEAARVEARERELADELARRTTEIAAADEALALARQHAEAAAQEAAAKEEAAAAARRSLEAELEKLRGEREAEARARESAAAEAAAKVAALEERLARERADGEKVRAALEARAAQVEASLAAAEAERERASAAAREAAGSLRERIDEREAAIRDREERLRQLEEEYRRFRDAARAREDDLAREVQDHLQQLGSLEAELESVEREIADREVAALPDLAREEADTATALELDEARRAAERRESEQAAEQAARTELAERAGAQEQLLAAARREVERLAAELSEARQGAMIAESTLRGDLAGAKGKAEELAGLLAQAGAERDDLRVRQGTVASELETREAELAAALEEAKEARAGRERVEQRLADVEAALAQAGQAQAESERGWVARATAAEQRAVEATRRAELFGAERREAERRGADLVREAETRFHEELARRDTLRGQEVQRLQALLQERSRRERALELELEKARQAREGTPAPAPAGTGGPHHE